MGSLAAMFLLSGHVSQSHGWRYAFGVGGTLGIIVFILRLSVPESPRWLMLRGHEEDAGKVVADIEEQASKDHTDKLAAPEGDKLKITVRDHTPMKAIFRNMLHDNRQRSILGLVLMVSQAFFFNAVVFSYGLVVKKFFHVAERSLPVHLLPFAIASFLGPLTRGRLFDKIGRKPMITGCYGVAAILLAATLFPFVHGNLVRADWASCSASSSSLHLRQRAPLI